MGGGLTGFSCGVRIYTMPKLEAKRKAADAPALTQRQQQFYDFIVAFRQRHGCSPSIPELQQAFGIRSPNGVAGHLKALQAKGVIRLADRGSRQIDLPRAEAPGGGVKAGQTGLSPTRESGLKSPASGADSNFSLAASGVASAAAPQEERLSAPLPLPRQVPAVTLSNVGAAMAAGSPAALRGFSLPLFGQIPAGPPEAFVPGGAAEAFLSLDEVTLGFRPKKNCFALRVRGDSMKDVGILDGDLVVVEPTPSPQANQIVAALIDGECTLKRLVRLRGQWFLKAENPAYPELHPRADLVIQGVVRTVVRRLS